MNPHQPSYRLLTLGRLSLVDEHGCDVPSVATRKRKLAVLAWLALARTPATRDRLIGLFWGESGEERARNSLSDALSSLRRILGRSALPAYRDQVMLAEDTPLSVDVLDLQTAAERGEFDLVIDLYGGPFLDGVHVDASPDFEQWSDVVRRRVDSLFVRACGARCDHLARAGRFAECEALARRWLTVDLASSEAAIHLLHAIAAPGTYAARMAAVREHDILAGRVEREFGVSLDPSITSLARALAADLKVAEPAGNDEALDSRTLRAADGSSGPAADDVKAGGSLDQSEPSTDTPPLTTRAEVRAPGPSARWEGRHHRRFDMRATIVGVIATLAFVVVVATRGRGGATGEGNDAPPFDPAVGSVPDPHSVAVLRFRNIGGDSANLYFSDGIAEEVIDEITRVRGVQVAPRSSSFPLSADSIDIREVARRLNVAAVLEGSVRRAGDRLRIVARLVNAADRKTLWHGTFDRHLTDALAVQEEVARAVAGALRVELARPGNTEFRRRAATDFETYELYLRGQYAWWNASTEEGLRRGIAHFRRALARDSAFAPAWAGLAGALLELTGMHDVPSSDVVPQARAALLRARSLDPSLAEAHGLLGYIATFHDQRWEEAEASFGRALALDERNTNVRLWYAWMLAARGRHDAAVRELRRAREFEPTSAVLSARLATMLYFARDFEGAIDQARTSIEADPRFWLPHRQLGEALVQIGQVEAAVVSLRQAVALSPTGETRARLAYGLARAGYTTTARAMVVDLGRPGYVSPVELARVHVALGEHALALQRLEEAVRVGASAVVLLNVEPAFDPLRRDPRFMSIVRRLGLSR